MRFHIQSAAVVMCAVMGWLLASLTLAARNEAMAGQVAPATQATAKTQFAQNVQGFDIKGTVAVDGGGSLQPADLTRVVVYLASDGRLDSQKPPEGHASVAQRHKAFVPSFTVIERGTEVEFPNFDDFDHNVFSLSKAAPSFDLDRYPKGKSKSRVFDKVGVVQVFCNIHPSMRAIVVVTPNAFFARADEKGAFVIHGVPSGTYKVVAWQERADEQTTEVTVNADGTTSGVAIQLRANRRSIVASEAPGGGGYGVERGLGIKRERLDAPVVKDVHDAVDPEPK